jgi:MOSC domain-containing protein YiiM
MSDAAAPREIGLAAVNVATPSILSETDEGVVWSGIAKRPVAPGTRMWLSLTNLAGDGQADLSVHGGRDKAVYAYPAEHLGAWSEELAVADGPDDLGPAPFGENLSTLGAAESDVLIGDQWAWGDAVLEVCQPRWPCFKLALYRRRADIQRRMRSNGMTGWYLRVLEPGEVDSSGPIRVLHRDPAGLSVHDAHRALGDRQLAEPELVRALAAHPALAAEWRDPLNQRLLR